MSCEAGTKAQVSRDCHQMITCVARHVAAAVAIACSSSRDARECLHFSHVGAGEGEVVEVFELPVAVDAA